MELNSNMTIYTITYNEELMLPYFINHYRNSFPNCKIVVYDNESTDNTVAIALKHDCEVRTYKTNNQINDIVYLQIKNNCWKESKGWVIVADCDELILVNENDLQKETSSILKFQAYNMVNHFDNLDIYQIAHGVRSKSYDKFYCFDASRIKNIHYNAGCHSAAPIGDVVYSDTVYYAFHYKYINLNYMIKRHAMFAKRLSEENKKRGYGAHYLYPKEQIKLEFLEAIRTSIKIF